MPSHRPVAITLTFTLVGPIVPATAFAIVAVFAGEAGRAGGPGEPSWLTASGALVFIGYLVGGIPALLTGVLSAIASRLVRHPAGYVAVSVASGAVISGALGMLWLRLVGMSILAVFGALAASACALLTCVYRYKAPAPAA
jgi:hypothetical protein